MERMRSIGLAVAALLFTAGSATAQETTSPADTIARPSSRPAADSMPSVARLDTMRVTARPQTSAGYDQSGFNERERRRGFGYFLTAESIERRKFTTVSMVLATVPGLTVVRTTYGSRVQSRGMADFQRRCEPAVYLDGSMVPEGSRIIENVIQPSDVRGIEVYLQHGTAPPPYDRSPCGSILVWSKLPQTNADRRRSAP